MLSYQQPENIENAFSGKDELMGNLRAAALACGVVASVLGGGIGVGYLTSSTVSTADIVSEGKKNALIGLLIGKRKLRVEGYSRHIIPSQDPEIMQSRIGVHGAEFF